MKMKLNVKKIVEKNYERIFVMTDIHGSFDLFEKILEKLYFSKNDLLIILGDSCDRGEYTYEIYDWYIVKRKKGYNIIHLLGNHEDMLFKSRYDEEYRLNWLYNGGNQTIRSFFRHQNRIEDVMEYIRDNRFYEEQWIFDFIEEMPHIIESENYLFVHAGIDFSKSLQEQKLRYIVWTRDNWYEKNNTEKTVYYGHTPQNEITVKNNCVNMDRGAFFSDVLNCIELKENKIYIVENGEVNIGDFKLKKIKNIRKKKGIIDYFKKIFEK